MYVDVVTYLFNYLAEHLKHGHSGLSSQQLRLRHLYLELVPPTISVTTLVAVTIMALNEAFDTILQPPPSKEAQPDLVIMLLFSGLNLVLDVFNVGCFARIDQAVGLPGQHHHWSEKDKTVLTEASPLLIRDADSDDDEDAVSKTSSEAVGAINLNMCSAWTHIFADTLRSVAVLLAAGFAYIFPGLLGPSEADSLGAIVVSIIILLSLIPLVQGLVLTAKKIRAIHGGHDDDRGEAVVHLYV